MLYRNIGSYQVDASVIALGAWAIGGWMWGGADDDESIKTIHKALDHGINFIDTAPVYGFGRSEQIVGKAIRGRRDKVILATKCGLVWDKQKGEFYFHADDKGRTNGPSKLKVYRCLAPDSIIEELERSLTYLETDYIDLYQTHRQESTTPLGDTVATLIKLKEQGKIRAIGVSNANLQKLKAYGPIVSAQEQYSMLDRDIEQNGVLQHCRENNIAMLAYSPLANGLLTGKLSPERKFNPGDLRRDRNRFTVENRKLALAMLEQFHPIAEQHNATLAQLVIAWTFAQPGITHVLCGARTPQQAIENAQAGRLVLSSEEIETLDEIVKKYALQ